MSQGVTVQSGAYVQRVRGVAEGGSSDLGSVEAAENEFLLHLDSVGGTSNINYANLVSCAIHLFLLFIVNEKIQNLTTKNLNVFSLKMKLT